jgi:hypothetical protein
MATICIHEASMVYQQGWPDWEMQGRGVVTQVLKAGAKSRFSARGLKVLITKEIPCPNGDQFQAVAPIPEKFVASF